MCYVNLIFQVLIIVLITSVIISEKVELFYFTSDDNKVESADLLLISDDYNMKNIESLLHLEDFSKLDLETITNISANIKINFNIKKNCIFIKYANNFIRYDKWNLFLPIKHTPLKLNTSNVFFYKNTFVDCDKELFFLNKNYDKFDEDLVKRKVILVDIISVNNYSLSFFVEKTNGVVNIKNLIKYFSYDYNNKINNLKLNFNCAFYIDYQNKVQIVKINSSNANFNLPYYVESITFIDSILNCESEKNLLKKHLEFRFVQVEIYFKFNKPFTNLPLFIKKNVTLFEVINFFYKNSEDCLNNKRVCFIRDDCALVEYKNKSISVHLNFNSFLLNLKNITKLVFFNENENTNCSLLKNYFQKQIDPQSNILNSFVVKVHIHDVIDLIGEYEKLININLSLYILSIMLRKEADCFVKLQRKCRIRDDCVLSIENDEAKMYENLKQIKINKSNYNQTFIFFDQNYQGNCSQILKNDFFFHIN